MTTYLTLFGGVNEIGGNKFLLETSASTGQFTPLSEQLSQTSARQTINASEARQESAGETNKRNAEQELSSSNSSIKPTRLLLDFGTSFSEEKEFYSGFLKPRRFTGINDQLSLGLLPALPGLYREDVLFESDLQYRPPLVDAVLLSHVHADHVGNLPYIDPAIPLYTAGANLPMLDFLQQTQLVVEASYLSGKRYVPRTNQVRLKKAARVPWQRTTKSCDLQTPYIVGETTVTFYGVDHSVPGATAIAIETPDLLLIYTGDLRKHGRRRRETEHFVEQICRAREQIRTEGKPTLLLSEGTRFSDTNKRSETDVEADVVGFLREANDMRGIAVASFSVLDIDRLTTFWRAAKAVGRKMAVSPRQYFLLQKLASEETVARNWRHNGWPDLHDHDLAVFFPRKVSGDYHTTDYDSWSESVWHDPAKRITPDNIAAAPERFVVYLSYSNMSSLLDFDLQGRGVFIYSASEPFDAEMEIMDQVWEQWRKQFNLERLNSHASGHASGPEIRDMIREIQPDLLFPVHTQVPEAFEALMNDEAGIRVVLAQKGRVYDLLELVSQASHCT